MRSRLYIFVICCLLYPLGAQAQEQIETFIEKKLETILEHSEEFIESSELFEKLVDLANNPININASDITSLLELKLITYPQFQSILNYRKLVGQIQSIQEIQFLDGFSKKALELIEPFIYAGESTQNKPKFSELFQFARHQMFMRYNQILQPKSGYQKVSQSTFYENPNRFYLGSPAKIYTRYKMTNKDHFSAAFVLEKDAGEILLKPKYDIESNSTQHQIPLIDFSSFHLSVSRIGIFKKVVLGDYHLQFGQGLTLWSNFAFNKSSEASAIKRYAGNIIPSTSSIENNFFRGIALALEKGKINMTLFYSNKNRDANLFEANVKGELVSFTSLQNTGLHRTVNEFNDRNILNEQLYGGRISLKTNTLQIGSTAYLSKWDASLLNSNQLYKLFEFSGNTNSCLGLDYQWYHKNISFYGEFAMSRNQGIAYINGMDFQVDSYSKFSISFRNYQPKYQNLYANAFAESSSGKNEKGLYLGFENSFLPKWDIQFYFDIFRYPWLKSRVNAPSKGTDYFFQLNHTPSDRFQAYLRYKRKHKQTNHKLEAWFTSLVPEDKQSFRLNFVYKPATNLIFKSRFEWVKYSINNDTPSEGILIYQQMDYVFPNQAFKLNFRYTNFNTDGFDSRIYTYENDVLYAFSIPAFYDLGNHFYLLLHYKINAALNFWFKVGHTHFKNKQSIGTGNEEINGSSKTEIKFQIRIQL